MQPLLNENVNNGCKLVKYITIMDLPKINTGQYLLIRAETC